MGFPERLESKEHRAHRERMESTVSPARRVMTQNTRLVVEDHEDHLENPAQKDLKATKDLKHPQALLDPLDPQAPPDSRDNLVWTERKGVRGRMERLARTPNTVRARIATARSWAVARVPTAEPESKRHQTPSNDWSNALDSYLHHHHHKQQNIRFQQTRMNTMIKSLISFSLIVWANIHEPSSLFTLKK